MEDGYAMQGENLHAACLFRGTPNKEKSAEEEGPG